MKVILVLLSIASILALCNASMHGYPGKEVHQNITVGVNGWSNCNNCAVGSACCCGTDSNGKKSCYFGDTCWDKSAWKCCGCIDGSCNVCGNLGGTAKCKISNNAYTCDYSGAVQSIANTIYIIIGSIVGVVVLCIFFCVFLCICATRSPPRAQGYTVVSQQTHTHTQAAVPQYGGVPQQPQMGMPAGQAPQSYQQQPTPHAPGGLPPSYTTPIQNQKVGF